MEIALCRFYGLFFYIGGEVLCKTVFFFLLYYNIQKEDNKIFIEYIVFTPYNISFEKPFTDHPTKYKSIKFLVSCMEASVGSKCLFEKPFTDYPTKYKNIENS